MTSRTIAEILPAVDVLEGGGFLVHRPFPTNRASAVDPFLMIDEMGPVTYAPGQAIGAPDHPHRGFETVTYMIDGEFQHADSAGHRGEIAAGDVQWMTAGSGVVHAEMPSEKMIRDGGLQHGFQIWINLPRADKWVRPRYQDVRAQTIPQWRSDDGKAWARVIAGRFGTVQGTAETRIPIGLAHVRMQPGAQPVEPVVQRDHTAIVYLMAGTARFGNDRTHDARAAIVFAHDCDGLAIENAGDSVLEYLLLTGQPIGEPIARYGPFVMNTADEVRQAFDDFRDGKMGEIEPLYS